MLMQGMYWVYDIPTYFFSANPFLGKTIFKNVSATLTVASQLVNSDH